jgi:hypothetical protein
MHRLVLENGKHRFGAIEQRVSGPIHVAALERVEHPAVGFRRELTDEVAARPLEAVIARCQQIPCLRLGRVDATRKQRLEPWVDAGTAEALPHEGDERKCGQVALVEHDRMTKVDRLTVVGVLCQQVEQRVRASRFRSYHDTAAWRSRLIS